MKSLFEHFPDEVMLEIYRYLHCGHVLYSFYNLNSRFNRSITDYCRHVILRRLSYRQFLHIYSNVLPSIGSYIISLTINRLQQTYFLVNFSFQMNKIFPNLNKLALDDWKNEELFSFVGNHLNELKYLRSIIIRGLRQSTHRNSIVFSIDDQKYLFDIIHKNTQVENIYFEPDCYSMTISSNNKFTPIQSNLIEMSISLSTTHDFVCLTSLIPNLRRLHVIIEELLTIDKDPTPFECLENFSLNAVDCYSTFENISSILRFTPTIKQLSMTLTTADPRLISGQQLSTLLSSDVFYHNNLIQSFKYAVYFSSFIHCFDSQDFVQSWEPISIAYTMNTDERKLYLLIHTLPYPSILLNINSILSTKFGQNLNGKVYHNIQYLCICHAKTLYETFTVIQHCQNIQDLTIQIDKIKRDLPVTTSKKPTINIPKLNHLEILSIFGIVDDWYHLKTLLLAANNISTLCIHIDCAIKLFEYNNDDILLSRVLHLYIDGHNSNIAIQNKHIPCLSRIFSGLHSLKIKYKPENLIEADIVGAILDNCQHLIVFTINGQISDDVASDNIEEWILKYSSRLKNSKTNYQVDICDDWFQIWL